MTIEFYISNNIVDLKNMDKPISKHLVSDMHFLIDPIKTFYKTADLFISESNIKLETGYFPSLLSYADEKKSFFFNTQDLREQIAFYGPQQTKSKIADFYFRKSPTLYHYERNLGDILKELSYFAGIWSTGYVWLMFFITTYNKNYFMNSLSNKLYNFPSQMKKRSNTELKLNQSKEFQRAFINDSPNSKSFSQKIFERIEIYLSYDKKNQISFWKMWKFPIKLFLFSIFGIKLDEKEQLMRKSKKNLLSDLDICNILKKLQEVEKIKDLLFTPEQQTLLSFTPKPEILSTPEEKKRISSLKNLSRTVRVTKDKGRFLANEIKYDSIKPFEDLILAWKVVKNSENHSIAINENLLKMFGEDIPKIMDLPDADIKQIKKRNAEFQKGFKIFNTLKSLYPKKQKHNKSADAFSAQNEFPVHKEKKELDEPRLTVENEIEIGAKDKEKCISPNKEEIYILDEREQIYFDKYSKENLNPKLYENLMEMNENISKICNFDINDKND